ncbi:autotransporter domain-containing protein [Salipiger mucosus]|uniref:Uncharacterized protein n=1 Tax=Salipiger mucosus DSM 16094 TaxID=1123237 RepID=S9Q4Q7_9RHOB|nr:autotransporter domain-containing protein [Salipiger mucosus]EPX76336.1 hypothetical protein Salmuc_00152 [Salipiger mucosus DSM 16094]
MRPPLPNLLVAALSLCLAAVPVRAGADELRDALTSGADLTLRAAFGAFDSVIGQAQGGLRHVRLDRRGLFLATRAKRDMPRVWSAFQAREYHGTREGHVFDLLAAYERPLTGETRAGLAAGLAKANLDTGERMQVSAFSVAPYLTARLNERTGLKAWLAFSRPDYRLRTGHLRARRAAAGVRANTRRTFGAVKLTGSLALTASRQVHPKLDLPDHAVEDFAIERLNGTIRSRATFGGDAPLKPYVDLALDLGHWRDAGGQGDHMRPSLRTGFAWSSKRHRVKFDLDGNRAFDAGRPLVLRARYDWRF